MRIRIQRMTQPRQSNTFARRGRDSSHSAAPHTATIAVTLLLLVGLTPAALASPAPPANDNSLDSVELKLREHRSTRSRRCWTRSTRAARPCSAIS